MAEAPQFQLTNEFNKMGDKIKGTSVLSFLKPLFKGMNDTDFQAVFSTYVTDFSLNEPDRIIAIQQLKYIYLGIRDQMNKIKQHSYFGLFDFQNHYILKRSQITLTNLPSINKQPTFQIYTKQLTQIVPYQITFFDSLYKRQEREKPNVKTPERLTQQTLEEPYYCYDFKIYQVLLENYQGPLMNKLVRFFYQVIDFRWIQALDLLKTQLVTDPNIRESPYLIPVFQNLKTIQQEIQKNPNVMKPIFQKRRTAQYPNFNNLAPEIIKKINENKNILDFVCNYCTNIYQQIQDPYLKATCYFLGKKFEQNSTYDQICNNDKLGVMIKFLFARRFLDPSNFAKYYSNFIIQTKINPKLEHIMFFKNKSEVVQSISSYWDENPNQLQKVALTCGIVIHKLGKGFNNQFPFLQLMVKTYQQLLRATKQKDIHKQYMMKMMTIRSSKQPLWEDLIVKPQFRLNCQTRRDDCVFLSMLQKFIYGGGQEKWNKLKTKSSVAADPAKKHYEVQAKHCPYCNFPTPRCSICLDQIKIFTVKSYLNQQIKRKTEKQLKPYMKLSQPLQQALIWCPSCEHGGHFGHLQSWFKQNKACPVDKCQCQCKY